MFTFLRRRKYRRLRGYAVAGQSSFFFLRGCDIIDWIMDHGPEARGGRLCPFAHAHLTLIYIVAMNRYFAQCRNLRNPKIAQRKVGISTSESKITA